MKSRTHIVIQGFVQGVCFRYKLKDLAGSLNIKGWVRNLDNDKVEAVFEGEEDSVKELVEYCKKGPSSAKVNRIDIKKRPYTGEFKEFKTIQ